MPDYQIVMNKIERKNCFSDCYRMMVWRVCLPWEQKIVRFISRKEIIIYEHRHQKLRPLIQQKSASYKRLFSSKSLEHFSFYLILKFTPILNPILLGLTNKKELLSLC
jgi:hypothetical protein